MKSKSDVSPWWYNGEPYRREAPREFEGFVYVITNLVDGRRYIGKKFLWSIRKKPGKARRQRTESDWKRYWSSSDTLKEDVKRLGFENFKREIIVFCKTRGDCNRIETRLLWENNVLESDDWYNDSIGNMRGPTCAIMESREWNKTWRG